MLYLLQGAACGGSLALTLGTDCLFNNLLPPAQVTWRYALLGVAVVWLQLGFRWPGLLISPCLDQDFAGYSCD